MWVGSGADTFAEKRFRDRMRFVSYGFLGAYIVITLRLFQLQVVRGETFAHASESNRTQVIFLRAPRGDFFDRNGQVLVTNRPSWSLMYSPPQEAPLQRKNVALRLEQRKAIEQKLQPYLGSLPSYWTKRLQMAFDTKKMVRLLEDVPDDSAFVLREMGDLLPGLRVVMEFRRGYPMGLVAPHLIGYLGEVDERDLREDSEVPKKPGDLVGKMGIERIYDDRLRGEDGGMLIEVDSAGKLKRVIRELSFTKGQSAHLTLDANIQRVAEEELANTTTKRGAAVVLDVNTGKVLAWASAPSFDPLGSIAEGVSDKNKPFFDRVYKGAHAPGSVFKIITAIAGFEGKMIRLSEQVNCVGYVALADKSLVERRWGCWKVHGWVNYWKAMSESCDSYFYGLGKKVTSQTMSDMAHAFGLGETVQNTLPGEQAGQMPNAAWKRRRKLGGWSTGDTFNMTIGQGFMTSTPLQIAVMMGGVATRGQLYRPYMVEKIVDLQGHIETIGSQSLLRSVQINDETWDLIHDSLRRVVKSGTGYGSYIPRLDVRGKTGTSQNPHGEDHAWFAAFAGYPKENVAISVVVFVENGGSGGAIAAPIAKRIIETALPPREGESS